MSKIIDNLARVEQDIQKLNIERALNFEKAFKSRDVETIFKAQNMYGQFIQKYNQQRVDNGSGMKAMTLDPFEASSSMGYYGKNASVTFDMLRAVSRAPIPRAVINTRKNQVVEYCKVQPDKYSKGFKFFKVGVENEDDLTDADKRYIDKLNKFILNCGDDPNRWDNDDFDNFIKKIVEDSLSLDQANAEIIPTRGFEPTAFAAVDATTMRFSDTHGNQNKEGILKVNGYGPSYVQIWQNLVCAEFYPWEMMFGIRNPSSSIRSNGYGRSELEDLIQTTTAMLNADTYNKNFFKNGISPKGMLMLKKGNLNGDRLKEFQREWQYTLAGSGNAHKTPMLDAESFEWIDMQKTNRDMEFSKYQEYLIKLFCAVYKISPEEIGFPLEGTGKSGLGNGNGAEEKEYSINKGLKPLLTEIQQWINKWIIGPKTNYKWEFRFVGIDVESAAEEEDLLIKAAAVYMTPDEIRAGKGLKPLPGGVGKLPLSPVIASMVMQGQQQQQEKKAKDEETDNQDRSNKNPFLDDEKDKNPFVKSFDLWCEENLTLSA